MTDSILLAFLSEMARRNELAAKNALMAAGGALIGAIATWMVCVIAFKAARVQKLPPRLMMIIPSIGGVLAGWLVWAWVSGGMGFGSGDGGGVAGSTEPSKGITATHRDISLPTNQREPADTLRIVLVRSKDYEAESKRYYLPEGRQPARNLTEIVLHIKEKQQQNPSLKTIEVVVYQDSIAETRGLVADLEDPVRPLGLTIKTHKPGTVSP